MGQRGRKRRLDLEAEYWRLLQSGVGPVAASKLLGIGRKTGYRWRAENPRKRLDWRSPARAMAAELAS